MASTVMVCLATLLLLSLGATAQPAWPNSGEHDAVTPIRDYVVPGSWQYEQLQDLPGSAYEAYTAPSSCAWGIADGVSHRMSLRLKNAMESLARNVYQTMGGVTYNIKVIAGYENATAQQRAARDTSLFFEGRALVIRLFNGEAPVDVNATLVEFYYQARLSGFDYIRPERAPGASNAGLANAALYVSVLPDYCYNERPLDLAFLLDGSSSIRLNQWDEAIDFVEAIISNYFIGLNQTRVALTTFSSDRGQNVRTAEFPNAPDCGPDAFFSRYQGSPICVCVNSNATCSAAVDPATGVTPPCNGQGGPYGAIQVGLENATLRFTNLSWWNNTGPAIGCSGGVPYNIQGVLFGSLYGNVRDELLFNASTSLAVVQNSATGISLPGGGTRISLGLENIRTHVMTQAAGARGSDVPKVLVVMTDGLASPGYEPNITAAALRDEGVTILAIGIGAADPNQLQTIATSSDHVFYVNVFDELPEIVSQIETLSCGACIRAEWDQSITVNLAEDDFRCVSVSCAGIPDSSFAYIETVSGSVAAYTSTSQFGGPLNFTYSDTGSAMTKQMPVSTEAHFLVLEGRASGSSTITVTFRQAPVLLRIPVSADASVDTLVTNLGGLAPSNIGDVVFSIAVTPGLPAGTSSPFMVTNDGVIRVAQSLAEVQSPFRFTVSMISTTACQSRQISVTIDLTTESPSKAPTGAPASSLPSSAPTTRGPTQVGETFSPSFFPTTSSPTTSSPTTAPLCATGLLPPRCAPPQPEVATPAVLPVSAAAPNNSFVASIDATTTIGSLRYELDTRALLAIESGTSQPDNPPNPPTGGRTRRQTNSSTIVTPFWINITSGEVRTNGVLPAEGTVTVQVVIVAVADGTGVESDPVNISLTVPLVPVTMSPTASPVVSLIAQGSESNNEGGVSSGAIVGIVLVILICLLIAMFLGWRFTQQQRQQQQRKQAGVENPMYSTADLGLKTSQNVDGPLYADANTAANNGIYADVGPGTVHPGHSNPTYGSNDADRDHGAAVQNTTYESVSGSSNDTGNGEYQVPLLGAPGATDTQYLDPASKPGDENYMDPSPKPTPQPVQDDVLYDVAMTPGYSVDETANDGASQEYLSVGEQPTYDAVATYDVTHEQTPLVADTGDVEADEVSPVYQVATSSEPVAAPRRPRLPTVSLSKEKPLPPNWHEAKDDDGNTYYYNSESQESSWDRPVLKVAVETNL